MSGWLLPYLSCTVLLVLQTVLHQSQCTETSIQCICTTTECVNEGKATCTSEHMCYVQNMQGEVPGNPGLKPGIIRGCIDDKTPLLCENRKPQVYSGPWPVLHCCKEEWCNKDVIPTVPTPWLEDMKKNGGQNFAGLQNHEGKGKFPLDGNPYHQQNDQVQYHEGEQLPPELEQYDGMDNARIYKPKQQKPRNGGNGRNKTINPLYIAVPVAGACVLLAIIIFAIYILKRQNALMAEYHQQHVKQQNQQKLCPIYHGNLKHYHHHGNSPHHHLLLGQHHHHHHQQQQQQQQTLIHQNNSAASKDLLAVESSKQRQYSDSSSERSSTGSETKLLMKV